MNEVKEVNPFAPAAVEKPTQKIKRTYRKRAKRAFVGLTDRMAQSKLPEIKTLRKTLLKWQTEVLNYFKYRITNARTEGFNNIAKLVQKRGFGYKNFRNYRLRTLNACA